MAKTSDTSITQKEETIAVLQHSVWSGALPPPDALQRFNNICPGAAEKIINQALAQTTHRIELEKLTIRKQLNQAAFAQWCALIIGLSGLGMGTLCILKGHDVAGGALAGGPIIGLAVAFITGKVKQANNLSNKKLSMNAAKPK